VGYITPLLQGKNATQSDWNIQNFLLENNSRMAEVYV
jgi:hypothetical protein